MTDNLTLDKLELLAVELTGYSAELIARVVARRGREPFLRVISRTAGSLAEDLTYRDDPASPSGYWWSWGEPVAGPGIADVARQVARVLRPCDVASTS